VVLPRASHGVWVAAEFLLEGEGSAVAVNRERRRARPCTTPMPMMSDGSNGRTAFFAFRIAAPTETSIPRSQSAGFWRARFRVAAVEDDAGLARFVSWTAVPTSRRFPDVHDEGPDEFVPKSRPSAYLAFSHGLRLRLHYTHLAGPGQPLPLSRRVLSPGNERGNGHDDAKSNNKINKKLALAAGKWYIMHQPRKT